MRSLLHSLFGADLAIDLGTANTLIGVAGEGLVINEPSIVAVEQATGRILSGGCAVGQLARQMLGRTPDSVSVVRPLRDGVITDFELCEAMLGYLMRKARRQRFGPRPRVLIGVPGCITRVEKRAVYNSAYRAGAGQVLLVGEAKAAALGVGLPVSEPVASMVCDIGGGTTEIAVLSMGEAVAAESLRVGGDAFDQAIVEYLRRHYSLRIGISMAESLRIEIGSAFPLEQELTGEVRGLDAISGLPRKASVTSEEIREALAPPIEQIVDAIKGVLDRAGPDLAADLVDNGVMLTGGGALTRGLHLLIAEQTGMPAQVADDPLTAVARGTQICLEHLDRWRGLVESGRDSL